MMKKLISIFTFLSLLSMTIAQEAQLTIHVNAPANTPFQDSVITIGNQGVWGFWIYPKSKALKSIGNNVWEGKYKFPINTDLEFKVTRGSYFKEALYNGNGQSPQSVKLKIQKDTIVVLNPSNWNDLYQRSIVGTVRYHHNFGSTFLRSLRNVVVWLPPSYSENSSKKFPVLYANDGQNLFDHTNLNGNDWRMDEIADSLMRKGEIEEFIIVGIGNSKDRMIEYNGTPEGENYLKFIVSELKPFIDQTYRTQPEREQTGIIGSSMGGLISLYALYTYPEVFSKAACLSSGFYFDDGDLASLLKKSSSTLSNSRIYLDCGGKDLDYDFLPSNQEVNNTLSKNKQISLMYKEFPDDPHNEIAWSKRLATPFKYLFPKK